MNILSRTFEQLAKFEILMRKDLKDGFITVNYLINENECKILDHNKIQKYLTQNKIHNNLLLREILVKCKSIINLWNIEFLPLKDRCLKEPFIYSNEDKGRHLSTTSDFYTLIACKDKLKSINSKTFFLKYYNYNQYQTAEIAQKCALIENWITAFEPSLSHSEIGKTNSNRELLVKYSQKPSSNDVKQRVFDNLGGFFFFQIHYKTNNGKEKNNDSVITTENWSERKDIFYSQRMETYNKNYTTIEKINLELEALEKLTINKTEYNVLKNRYKDFLLNKLQQPQQNETGSTDEIKENEYIEIFKNNIGYTIFLELHFIYKNKTNKQANYSFLFYALQSEYLVCNGTKFIKFLSKRDIHIDKIDSRQSGSNKKLDLFNSIKSKYQKKHE